jgi:hypothetical protein
MRLTSNYIPQNTPGSVQPGTESTPHSPPARADSHYERVKQELRTAGLSWYGTLMMESRFLPRMIRAHENIKAISYGWQPAGVVMLVATDRRIIFLDKKPFYLRDDEVGYDSVRGVSLYQAGFTSTVVLHTQVQDFIIRTFNKSSVQKFIDYVEMRSFEHKNEEVLDHDWAGEERTV